MRQASNYPNRDSQPGPSQRRWDTVSPCKPSAPTDAPEPGSARQRMLSVASLQSKRLRTFAQPNGDARTQCRLFDGDAGRKHTIAFLAQAGNDAPKYTAEDLRIISSPIDFIGLNAYTPTITSLPPRTAFRGFTLALFPASFPHMNAAWLRPGPEAMYWAPRHVAKLWNVVDLYHRERDVGERPTR